MRAGWAGTPSFLLLASTAVGVLSCFITLIVAILTLLNPDGQSESLTASLSTGARTALGLGALAAMGAVIILGCWVVSRLCDVLLHVQARSPAVRKPAPQPAHHEDVRCSPADIHAPPLPQPRPERPAPRALTQMPGRRCG